MTWKVTEGVDVDSKCFATCKNTSIPLRWFIPLAEAKQTRRGEGGITGVAEITAGREMPSSVVVSVVSVGFGDSKASAVKVVMRDISEHGLGW